jgi:hypothetical protein
MAGTTFTMPANLEVMQNGEPVELHVLVRGYYYKERAGTYYDPPEPAEVDDLCVWHDGFDITATVPRADLDRFEEEFMQFARDRSNPAFYYDDDKQ